MFGGTNDMSNIHAALIIPSLDPDEKILRVVEEGVAAGFQKVILVDDGSRPENKRYFEELNDRFEAVVVLTHPQNLGKGDGLKTAFRYYLENCAENLCGAVTADGDGQHTTRDIVRCVEEMGKTEAIVFGCRDFTLPDVPARSRFGNHFTSGVFRLVCGRRLSDTQTGLRAFPNRYIAELLNTEGSRFEYETNMILDIHKWEIPLREVKIETVYEDNNGGSHFRPVRDSVRIYKLILKHVVRHHHGFKYSVSALLSFHADLLCNFLFLEGIALAIPGGFLARHKVIFALLAARVVSSLFNFTLNRNYVFSHKESPLFKDLAKYYTLCVPQALVNAFLVRILVWIFTIQSHGLIVLMNLTVQIALFFISFFIQKKWVFKKTK